MVLHGLKAEHAYLLYDISVMKNCLTAVILVALLVCVSFLRADSPAEVIPAPVVGRIMCPATIAIRESLIEPVKGWEVYKEASGPVASIDFYSWDPNKGALILSDDDGLIFEGPHVANDDTWILCEFAGTKVALARPLGLLTKSCKYIWGEKNKDGKQHETGGFCE
ncbi:MAG TPA: STY0301 family protein [Candidatus Saccharimonadales bacterium]|jgi:hypothetical protein|nr:STY0301 family protein [Candidatus Saccharimonadales bacterium]